MSAELARADTGHRSTAGTNTADSEKSTLHHSGVDQPKKDTKRFSFFSKKKQESEDSDDEGGDTEKKAVAIISDEEKQPPPVGITELFRYTTKLELLLNFVGLFAAIGAGAAQPLMSIVFGSLTNTFVKFGQDLDALANGTATQTEVDQSAAAFRHSAGSDALILVYIGLAIFVCTFTYMYGWVYTGEMSSKRIREKYLQAVLRQDIAFFDNVGAGEIATRIQTDTHLVQQGMSEKVAICVSFLSAFFTGFIVAYIRSWRLALAISSILPCIGITGAIMNRFISRYMQ